MNEILIEQEYTTELEAGKQTQMVRFQYKGCSFCVPRELLNDGIIWTYPDITIPEDITQ